MKYLTFILILLLIGCSTKNTIPNEKVDNQNNKLSTDTTHTKIKEVNENSVKIKKETIQEEYTDEHNKEIINTNDIEIPPIPIGKGYVNTRLGFKKSVLIINDTDIWKILLNKFGRLLLR